MTFHKRQYTKRNQLFCDSLGDDRPTPAARRKEAQAGAYLAVSGADRKPHVGGDHHRERGGQFNGEAAVGGRQETDHSAPFVWASQTPPGAKVSPGHSLN